ncbi:MAG: TraR/DksA C4-type zinc finger protein [Saprospiraceae bacterium]|nr:TraR/DksA C4-type zinc finger protein [Saprospiraceae bacterium]
MNSDTNRYSEAELAEFKSLIDNKLEKAKEQLDSLTAQIFEITENSDDEYGSDWMDDTGINNDIEMLNDMAIRQRKFIRDLENALIRIRNKSYGICSVTGQLIDKKRLMAVPTTTKSLAVKLAPPVQSPETVEEEEEDETPKEKKKPEARKIISRIIRKNSPKKAESMEEEEFEDDFFDDDFDSEADAEGIDFDDLPDENSFDDRD